MREGGKTILLVHPEISRTKYNFVGIIENECLELEYLSAALKAAGHQVVLFDRQVDHGSMAGALKKAEPDVVYICGRSRQENFIKEYCREAKAFDARILTVAGGLHVQHSGDRMYEPYIDLLLITFDIFVLCDVIAEWFAGTEGGKKTDLSRFDGICWKQDGDWIRQEAAPFDINQLPLPDRTYFYEHPRNYRYLELEHIAHVRTAYCCPYTCRFCYRNRLNSGVYVRREMTAVVNEIKQIASDHIYLVDDDFLYDRNRLLEFIGLIRQEGIQKRYICYGRADFIVHNRDIMQQLKEIGFYYVLVGLEAVGDRRLQNYNKKSDSNHNTECVRILNEIGIHTMGMFIIDLDFKAGEFKELYRWIKRNRLRHAALSIFVPEFGLDTYEEYRDRLITDNPSHWDYLHVVATPFHLSTRRFYFYYYCLVIRLLLKAKREGVYDFVDYGEYIRSFMKNIFVRRSRDDE